MLAGGTLAMKSTGSQIDAIDVNIRNQWLNDMNQFSEIINIPGVKQLPTDSPPFHLYNISKYLEKKKMD